MAGAAEEARPDRSVVSRLERLVQRAEQSLETLFERGEVVGLDDVPIYAELLRGRDVAGIGVPRDHEEADALRLVVFTDLLQELEAADIRHGPVGTDEAVILRLFQLLQ